MVALAFLHPDSHGPCHSARHHHHVDSACAPPAKDALLRFKFLQIFDEIFLFFRRREPPRAQSPEPTAPRSAASLALSRRMPDALQAGGGSKADDGVGRSQDEAPDTFSKAVGIIIPPPDIKVRHTHAASPCAIALLTSSRLLFAGGCGPDG